MVIRSHAVVMTKMAGITQCEISKLNDTRRNEVHLSLMFTLSKKVMVSPPEAMQWVFAEWELSLE